MGAHVDRGLEPTGRRSVAVPERAWYPAVRSRSLRRSPVEVPFLDRPLALWRDRAGAPHAVVDRCSHRNVPLSGGRVAPDGCIECPYHGWRFDGSGACTAVPGLVEGPAAAAPTRDVAHHAVAEHDGFVWVWGRAGDEPSDAPRPLPDLRTGPDGERRPAWQVGEVVFPCDLQGTLHAALENTLDVPHTAFLHRGLFRGARTKELHAERRAIDGGIEVEFSGEPVGLGPIQGGPLADRTFLHWDRYLFPGTAQVEYRIDGWLQVLNTVVHLPVSPTVTRAWFVLRWWSRVPAAVVRPIVAAQGRVVLRQDATALRAQSANVDRFGGERFASTDLDLLGPAIWHQLRRAVKAEAGGPPAGAEAEAEVAPDVDAALTFTA